MMDGMEMGMGMMLAMGLFWVLVIIVLVLAISALVKYLRSPRSGHRYNGTSARRTRLLVDI